MTPSETRRSPNHLFHEVNLIELANGPGIDNDSWTFVSTKNIIYLYSYYVRWHKVNKVAK